jgi:protein involved in polysaccharide export with SLBB domain
VEVALTLISSENRVVYVQGEVGRSGSIPLTPGLTMLKALTLAGGTNDQANLKSVVLIHYKTPVDVVIYRANLKELLRQKNPIKDVLLSAQDVIYVPKSGIAKANLFIDQYITRMLPFSRGVNYTYSDISNTDVAPAAAATTTTP